MERVVSTYHYFSHTPDFRDDCCRALYQRQLSLREFADLEWMGNTATRYAAGKSPDEFAFVGIVERFGESLLRFRERFGVGQTVPVPHNNVNQARNVTRNRLSAADFDYILSRNASDYWWYEKARADLQRDQRGVIAFPHPNSAGGRPAPARRINAGGLAGACWSTGTARPASA